MGFSDRAFAKTNAEFEILFNQVGLYPNDNSSKGSVRDFFRENSYGALDLTVTIVGPYVAPNTMKYYATHEREFAAVAAQLADADVDFNDFAENGRVENFHILFAGFGDENINNGNQIWSHKWQLASPLTLDGVRISVYSCSPELRGSSGNNTTYVGVVCHELCHVFGSPDYYDTSGSNNPFAGTGNWDLMANGSWNDSGRQPGHVNMFQKILYGWVTPVELTSFTEVTDMPPASQQPVAYSIKANTNGELYVLENRQKVGFDTSLPGNGLLIWHVHPGALNGNGSNAAHPQQLYPVVASSSYAIPTSTIASYGSINSAGTPFPGSANKHAFTAKTIPTMFTWTDLQPIAKPITEITETDKMISFKFLDGPTTPVTNLQQEVTGANVKLTWVAADHEAVLGYRIYRDGALLYTINNKNTTTYTQIGVTNGTYEYGVSAFYESTESAQVTVGATVAEGSDSYVLPPANLTGRATLNRALLNWTRPFNAGSMTIAGAANTVYSFDDAPFALFAGALWGPDQLKGMDGYDITQIQFYMFETAAAATHTVQIWEVDDEGVPVLVRDQQFTGTRSQASKTVTLTNPYTIDSSKEYLIGVEIYTLGEGCLIVDGSPIVPMRNWFYVEDDGWLPMEIAGFANNFVTSFYLTSGNPSSPNPNVVVMDSQKLGVTGNNLSSFAQKAQNQPATSSLLKAGKSSLIEAGPAQVAQALSKYVIYRDGEKIGEVSGATSTSFEDTGLTAGTTYSYCVSAVYANDNASEGTCIELTTLALINSFNPVENLKAKGAGDDVTVTWEAPYVGGTATYVTSTSNPSSTNVSTASITEAIRFEPNDLKRMEGFEITKVRFHTGSSTTARTYTIQIWSGGNGTTPGTLVHEEAATLTNNAWNDITLTTPVPVDIYEDLWVGVKVTRTGGSGNYSSPRYTSGVVNRKSNLYHNGTSWTTTNNVVWPISATIEPGAEVAPVTGYKISRDGSDLAEVSAATLSYSDESLQPGEYNYCVTAVYDTDESDAVCVSVTAEEPVNPHKPVEDFKSTLVDNKVTLNWNAPFKGGFFGHSAQTTFTSYAVTGIMATRFTREDLIKLQGTKLTRVYFGTHTSATTANTTYTLRIYAGAKGDEPERVIHEQEISSFTGGGWNAVTLSTPIDVNIYEDLWIGIVAAVRSGSGTVYRMTCDAGPAIQGKGNTLYFNNVWTVLSAVGGGDYNWAILGYAEPTSSLNAPVLLTHDDISSLPEDIVSEGDFKSVLFDRDEAAVLDTSLFEASLMDAPVLVPSQIFATPDAYVISRNGEPIATLANDVFTYEDALSITGDYTYCVTAQYADDQESDPKCADVSFISECDAQPENVTATRTDKVVSIEWEFTRVVAAKEEALFSENFESGIPASWKNVDADADDNLWRAMTGTGATGTGFVTSDSYDQQSTSALEPDNWLITPAITLSEENRLNYYVMPYNPSYPADHYGVFISTTDSEIASFDSTPLFEETLAAPATWRKRTIDLSDYEGETVYIAFRHFNCTDQVRMNLDDVSITKDMDPLFNIYENGTLIDQVTGNEYERVLEENGTYTYCVSFAGNYCESELVCADDVDMYYQLIPTVVISNKVYDATTDATIESITFADMEEENIPEEGVDYEISAVFSSANVGTDITVNITMELSEAAMANYRLPVSTFTATADITAAELTISGLTANDKSYDGTADATLSGTPTLDGVIGTDDVQLTGTPAAEFAYADAGGSIEVYLSGIQIGGDQAANYTLTHPSLWATIIPAPITITPQEGQWKYRKEADPELLYISEGWQLDDDEDLLTGELSREDGEETGEYLILQGNLAVNSDNYTILFVDGVSFVIENPGGINTINVGRLKVYPNPIQSGHELTVVSETPDTLIRIFSVSGVIVKEQQATGLVTKINLTLPAGIYIVSVGAERVKIEVR